MSKEIRCRAEMTVTDQLGEGVAHKHCKYVVGGSGSCALGHYAERNYKVKFQRGHCLKKYPDNYPKSLNKN